MLDFTEAQARLSPANKLARPLRYLIISCARMSCVHQQTPSSPLIFVWLCGVFSK